MSMEISSSKKKYTKFEAQYLYARPWLTSEAERKALKKVLSGKSTPKKEEGDSTDGDDNEE